MCLKLLVISVILLFKIASGNDDYNWDPQNRLAPPEPSANHDDYIISEQRLKEIRQNFLYWFFDKDALGGRGDLQTQIHTASPQIEKNLNFYLPFFGNRFNYTRVSINGYLEFSDAPQYYTYPLRFPIKDWPKVNDPSFIAIFFSKCRPGIIYETDIDQRSPGVYFRLENDLITRTDRFGVEVRERVMWDIREGIIGAQNFIPKHVIFVTWKNLTFSDGIDAARSTTNTFQLALATDELHTYAIFNYMLIEWTSHPEAGGDVQNGFGGISAFVGFNSGNGTQSYEYLPYSQSPMIQDLKTKGFSNSFPGRHIFRIDETIMLVTCTKDMYDSQLQFIFSPETGMSGTIVYITGPCFDSSQIILCHFGTEDVVGTVVDRHRVFCIQPVLKTQGLISLEISVGNQRFKSNKKYLVTI